MKGAWGMIIDNISTLRLVLSRRCINMFAIYYVYVDLRCAFRLFLVFPPILLRITKLWPVQAACFLCTSTSVSEIVYYRSGIRCQVQVGSLPI